VRRERYSSIMLRKSLLRGEGGERKTDPRWEKDEKKRDPWEKGRGLRRRWDEKKSSIVFKNSDTPTG